MRSVSFRGMKRVIIIGNCGSGKSYFSKKLSKITGLPLVHLDKIYWLGNKETLSKEEFDLKLKSELEKDEWIIDGNYNRTIRNRLDYCDTVIYFDIPTFTCLKGVFSRTFKNLGKTRDDMSENRPERFDLMFLKLCKNVLTYNKKHRKYYYRLLTLTDNVQKIVFKSRNDAEKFLDKIKQSV